MKHAELLEQTPSCYEWQGYLVSLDSFVLRGSTAVLAGKLDLVATLDNEALAVDMKVGLPNAANTAQVMLHLAEARDCRRPVKKQPQESLWETNSIWTGLGKASARGTLDNRNNHSRRSLTTKTCHAGSEATSERTYARSARS